MVPSTTKEPAESPMAHEIRTGTILIKDNVLLPKGLQFKCEPCAPGWRILKDFNGYALDREIRKTGWTFFCLAEEIRATVFGIDGQTMIRRALQQILAQAKSERFNSLEITRVASVGSERFPPVRYVTVSAQSRHIQESLFLYRTKDLPELERRKSELPSDATGIASDKTPHAQEPTKQFSVVSILSQ
jgi:hypothetical protein